MLVWGRFSITDAKFLSHKSACKLWANGAEFWNNYIKMLSWNTAHLEEREGASVAGKPQSQHALQLWDGNMEGSRTGESLNNRLWQIGGEETQLKPKHAKLGHKRLT